VVGLAAGGFVDGFACCDVGRGGEEAEEDEDKDGGEFETG